MLESLSLDEENIVKDIRNLLRLKKELNYTPIKGIKNLFWLEKETKAIRSIRNPFEHEEENPVRVNNFWSNSYIKQNSNDDGNKTLSRREYLHKIRPYLTNIIINLKIFDF